MFEFKRPINRIGFSLFVAGIIGSLIAFFWGGIDNPPERFFELTYDFYRRGYYGWQLLGRYSLIPLLVGAVLAWAYEPTIGRWARWIAGKPAD